MVSLPHRVPASAHPKPILDTHGSRSENETHLRIVRLAGEAAECERRSRGELQPHDVHQQQQGLYPPPPVTVCLSSVCPL